IGNDFMATPSSHRLTAMAAMVPRVGHKRVKPSVYLSPIAQPTSHKPAMKRVTQAMCVPFISCGNYFDVDPSSRRRDDTRKEEVFGRRRIVAHNLAVWIMDFTSLR